MTIPIYLDYAATTPVDPRVAKLMTQHLTMDGCFGNPASRSHRFGWQAEEAVENARVEVAELINADPREIVFTSGATESNNLAIKGAGQFYGERGRHIVTLKTEHKAVLDTCVWMETQGFSVTYLDVGADGLVELEVLRNAIRSDTILVSTMLVNNEIGVIQNIVAIAAICAEQQVLLHVDAAQAVGKIPVDVRHLNADLLSISAHKMYGPKGVGALFVRRRPRIKLAAQIHGGGHERGMRSGTLATHQIAGLGMAAALARQELAAESRRILTLKQHFLEQISRLPAVTINGSQAAAVPGIANVSFADVDGESLVMALKDLAVSTGSACASATLEPSYVLRALGLSHELAHASIRFSFGRFTATADVDKAAVMVCDVVSKLRRAGG